MGRWWRESGSLRGAVAARYASRGRRMQLWGPGLNGRRDERKFGLIETGGVGVTGIHPDASESIKEFPESGSTGKHDPRHRSRLLDCNIIRLAVARQSLFYLGLEFLKSQSGAIRRRGASMERAAKTRIYVGVARVQVHCCRKARRRAARMGPTARCARACEDLAQRLHEEGRTAWDHWGPEIVRATERLEAFDASAASGSEPAGHLSAALAVRRRHSRLHPLCWFRRHEEYLAAFRAPTGLEGEAAEAGALRRLEGEETILTRLTDDLCELAVAARTPTIQPASAFRGSAGRRRT